jgi:ryanodine receptor 2
LFSGEQARAQAAAAAEAAVAQQAAMAAVEAEAKQETSTEASSSGSSIDLSQYSHRVVSFLARNFYNLKYVALVLAFCINFMLLFYKVCKKFYKFCNNYSYAHITYGTNTNTKYKNFKIL